MPSFKEKFQALKIKTKVCVGLDPEIKNIPSILQQEKEPILAFNKALIDATAEYVAAYKPNIAFYEQYGLSGLEQLAKTIAYIPEQIPVILDAKRGDIGNTAKAYAKAAFEFYRADAITLAPYMGEDSLTPFLEYPQTYAFVLGLTSNKSAADFQKPDLFLKVAQKVKELDQRYGNCGLVAGATQGSDLAKLRAVSDDLIFLVPGIGAQGGDLEQTIACVKGTQHNFLINSSRGIIYAGNGADFAQAAAASARKLMQEINNCL